MLQLTLLSNIIIHIEYDSISGNFSGFKNNIIRSQSYSHSLLTSYAEANTVALFGVRLKYIFSK